jgi:transposase InsO family protein
MYHVDDIKAKTKEQIDKSSARISLIFDKEWLSRYPRPKEVIFDNGSEFKKDFLPLLQDFKIKPKCTTVENPQANGAVERIHQVVRDMIVTKDLNEVVFDLIDPWGPILSSVAYAIRASYHSTLAATPAQLVFGRDMIFNIRMIADWKSITERKRTQILKDNKRENSKRIEHIYAIGDKVYVNSYGVKRKLGETKKGPFEVTEVSTNGTVRVQMDKVNRRLNIRRLEPHFE